jgi:hypothetical protein
LLELSSLSRISLTNLESVFAIPGVYWNRYSPFQSEAPAGSAAPTGLVVSGVVLVPQACAAGLPSAARSAGFCARAECRLGWRLVVGERARVGRPALQPVRRPALLETLALGHQLAQGLGVVRG